MKTPLLKMLVIFISALAFSSFSWAFQEGFDGVLDGFISVLLLCMLALMIENLATSKARMQGVLFAFALSGALGALPGAAYLLGYDMYSALGLEIALTSNEGEDLVRLGAAGGGGANTLGILSRIGVFSSLVYLLIGG